MNSARPGGTALLLVDLQNAFCHAEGSFHRRFGQLAGLPQTLSACKRLHIAARARGCLTLFTQLEYLPDYSDAGLLVHSLAPGIKSNGAYLRGSWDAAFADDAPQPLPGDQIIRKTRYDPFINTPLEALLRERDVIHLVIAGVLTNVCVEATARSAFDRDFHISVVDDATSALTSEIKAASLKTLSSHFGNVLGASAMTLWEPPGMQ